MAAESGMVDDGQSAKEVYRVDNFDLVQVPEEDYGKFYSGDCYVVLYAYNDGRRDCYLIYYWLVSILYISLLDNAPNYLVGWYILKRFFLWKGFSKLGTWMSH